MIGKWTNELLEKFALELKKEDNMVKLKQSIIKPLIYAISNEISPWFFLLVLLLISILICQVINIVLFIKPKHLM